MSDETAPPRSFRRRGLGRGLEALLTSEPDPSEGPPLVNLDPRTVAPNPEQPRRSFDPESLRALGDSIRLHGLLHPIVVQRDGDDAYRLVAGERRLRAAQLAGVSA
ncbi:MAG TPA: ParB/RepB/Spo0J family partition protein, partial [Candidatus Dormibacteraeota bacterium]